MCRIVQRELLFDLGVAYGIDCLLIDPTLGGRCDTFTTFDVSVSPKTTTVVREPWAKEQPSWVVGPCCEATEGWSPVNTGPKGSERHMTVLFRFRINNVSLVPYKPCPCSFIHPHTHPSIPPPLRKQLLGTNCVPLFYQSFSNPPTHSVIPLTILQALFEPLPEKNHEKCRT